MFESTKKTSIEEIELSGDIKLYVLRLDKIHPFISGNKWYKLKYNIEAAKNQKIKTLLTFGGAYSNHIAAVAAAGKEYNLKSIGVIRGEERLPLNSTLQLAQKKGMIFHYLDRVKYRDKNSDILSKELKTLFGDFYQIPEGGTNNLAIKGTEEILQLIDIDYDYVCSPIGTGGTLAGLINSCPPNKRVIGFSALKGDFLVDEIKNLINLPTKDFEVQTTYHFGGYAKHKPELIKFINDFKQKYNIPLDPIYTGKMMYGIFDLIKNNNFKDGKTIVAIHTGGLQGIKGFNDRFNNILI